MKSIDKLKKDIIFQENLLGNTLTFHSTWGVFCPTAIDEGTKMLLDYIEYNKTDKVLDIGCGYGPIGVALAKHVATVDMVDKDFVSVDYANVNAKENNCTNTKAYLSNGFSNVKDTSYDLIVSNVPAKVGRELLWILLQDTKSHLDENGTAWFVVINGLRDFLKNNLKEVFGNYKKVKQGKNYVIFKTKKHA